MRHVGGKGTDQLKGARALGKTKWKWLAAGSLLACGASPLLPEALGASTADTLDFQGYLRDANGLEANGPVTLTFRIFNVPTGGSSANCGLGSNPNCLWTDTLNATVVGGAFFAELGDTHAPAVINVVGFWLIGLPVIWVLAFRLGGGAVGLWWGIVVGLAAVALILLGRVRVRLGRAMRRVIIDDVAVGEREGSVVS